MSVRYKKGVFKKGMVVCWRKYVYSTKDTPSHYEVRTGIVTKLLTRYIMVAIDGGTREEEVDKSNCFPLHPSAIAYFQALEDKGIVDSQETEEILKATAAIRAKWKPQITAASERVKTAYATIPDEYKGG